MPAHAINNFGRTTFSSLRLYNFRLYFIGQGVSLVGTWMQSVSQAWLVLQLSGSGTMLGIVAALQFLPVLFFAPLGGVLADRFSKRRLLAVTQSAAGMLALLLGVLVGTGQVRMWMVCVLAFLFGCTLAVDNPTRQTFVAEMVGEDDIKNAVTLNSMIVNLARVAGPSVAGGLIAWVGLAPCFFVNGISYFVVLWCLKLMRPEELHRHDPVGRLRGQLREGFGYVRRTPVLRDVLVMLGIVGMLTYEFNVILPLMARYTFNGDAAALAALTSGLGLGAVVGGLYTASRKESSPAGLVMVCWFFCAAMLLVAAAPNIILATTAMVLVGACSIGFTSQANSLLQLNSSRAMRGRVMSLWTVALLGSTPVGGPVIGWIGEHAGPRWGMVVGGLAAAAAGLYGIFMLRRHAKQAESGLPK